ncbi:cytochrome P450 [Micromonospora sonneratiae]|uniref:Cytochrome P450 n=1 Tax=Micromonospora sonneratiae TaxID=1184706 RepID=A0ABW3YAD5_9ACTN
MPDAEAKPAGTSELGEAKSPPPHRLLPRLARDPHQTLIDLGNQAGGALLRLDLGLFRPYLVTHPAHVQHIMRDNVGNYTRDGNSMLWRSVRRAAGDGILSEGPGWVTSRRIMQPLFTPKRIDPLIEEMASAVSDAVDELDEAARTGQPIDIAAELSRIVCHAVTRVFFADKISVPDALRLVSAQDTLVTSAKSRFLVPFMPDFVPMPGDRAFRDALHTIDELLLPVVREARRRPSDSDDVVATLGRARTEDGHELDEQRMRDDVVAMFAVTTETTYAVLTWLWPILDQHPEIADRLYDEIETVVGAAPVDRSHLPELRYTRMVLDELLRMFPPGWLLPRRVMAADVLGGVPLKPGATVILSPYVTQRMAAFWDRPEVFDPERFAPDQPKRAHRYSYYPFGGGPHQCIGAHLFSLEAQIIVATLLSRFRFRLRAPGIPVPKVAASLRVRDRVEMTLLPVKRPAAA